MEHKGSIDFEDNSRQINYSNLRTESHFDHRITSDSNTVRTTPTISNLITGSSVFSRMHSDSTQQSSLSIIPQETVLVGATLLENFGNHQNNDSEQSLIMADSSDNRNKRKDSLDLDSDTNTNKKRKKDIEDEALSDSFDDGNNYSGDDGSNYDSGFMWPPFILEPLPISITLPFLRAYANKKFDAPIPLFVPPALLVGSLHHFPAMLTLPSFSSLPTSVPLYPQSISFASYFPYEDGEEEEEGDEDDLGFSQDSEGEDSIGDSDDMIDSELMPSQSKGSNNVSPLTALASLASGTVKNHTQIL